MHGNPFSSPLATAPGEYLALHASVSRERCLLGYISPARLFPHVLEMTPCLWPDYVARLLSLSGEEIARKNFYRKLVVMWMPGLMSIPYHATGKAVDTTQTLPGRARPDLMFLMLGVIERLPRISRPLLKAAVADRFHTADLETRWWIGRVGLETVDLPFVRVRASRAISPGAAAQLGTRAPTLRWTHALFCESSRRSPSSIPHGADNARDTVRGLGAD